MRIKRRICCIVMALCMILLCASVAFAMNFDAESMYDSIYIVSTERGFGSGFGIGPNLVVTNAHVIEDADDVRIENYRGERMDAEVYASDEKRDIALLVVDSDSIVPLKLASEDSVRIGDDIYTVGAPENMAYTLTKGIISSTDRQIRNQSYYQIDAPVNEGNSGGPLLNEDGEVIGIITMKLDKAEGIGLAIPVDDVKTFIEGCGLTVDEGSIKTTVTVAEKPDKNVQDDGAENPKGRKNKADKGDDDGRSSSKGVIRNGDTRFILILLVISLIANAVLVIMLVYRSRKDKSKYEDPSERTDFDIEIRE